MSAPDNRVIVIVGGVAGGATAATRARRCNENARIIIYEKDGYASFANCGLPYYLGGEIPDREKLLVAKPETFRDRYNSELNTGHEVTRVDPDAHEVHVRERHSGREFTQHFDRLILAPGAAPIVPPMEGAAAPNVFTLRNMEDIRVNEYMQTSRPEVYAVGDAVAYQNGVTCSAMRVPLAGPANRAGRIAGEHAAHDRSEPMAPVLGTAIIRVFRKTAALTGLTMKAAQRASIPAKEALITANHHAGYYPDAQSMTLKLVYCPNTGRVLGAQAVGGDGVDKRIDVIATAIGMGGTVRQLAGLDLCYAPPFGSARDPVHVVAFVAINDLDGLSPTAGARTTIEGKQLVDVRTPTEVAQCCHPAAVKIPLDELRTRIDELDPSRETIVTCQSGLRAHLATCILKQHGFPDVHNLTGGMNIQQRVCPELLIRET